MPNPGGEIDLSWWQSALGGLGALLVGWAGGKRRGRTNALEEDSGITAVSLEAHRTENAAEHDETRKAILATLELIRSEGDKNRQAIHELGQTIAARLEHVTADVRVLLDRHPRDRRQGD